MRNISAFLTTLALCAVVPPSFGAANKIPSSVADWGKTYAKMQPLDQWNKNYPMPWGSWFGDTEDVVNQWFLYFGPLGVQARSHDATWGNMNEFKKKFPEILTDKTGELLANAFEVINVIPGSPADGFLQKGDLLLAMDGTPFQTASALRHRLGKYQYQESRGLEMHAGELLDKAEARGKVTFTVIRPSEVKTPPEKVDSPWKKVASASMIDGADKKAGLPLDIPLKGGEICRLTVTDGGNGNGSDGFTWKNLRLTGPKGNIPLHELTPLVYQTGWGGQKIDKQTGDWWAHANSEIIFQTPAGTWTLKGHGEANPPATVDAQVDTKSGGELPPQIKALAKNVTFPIMQLGSYKTGFPKNCPKAQKVIEMTAAWLAAQQAPEGCWGHPEGGRPGGYTKSHYDTAVAGLALMATGDPAYDAQIKKAAEFIAFSGVRDWWCVPLSTSTIFLCEYYLRYKDDRMVLPIRNAANRLINEMLYGDYVSGHGIHPGYRGTGVSVGGSHMALALSLAAKTPAQFDRSVIDKMLVRAQQIAPSGMVPYGRTAENFSLEPSLENGATYAGRNAPYLIASYIHGGPTGFTKNCSALFSHGALGGADQGHSTETLTMLWTFPASASVGVPVVQRQLESFLWKLTMLRTFDGSFCFNANRLEYQGAEGVLNVYIRTGAWLLGLNSYKQNLAITGDPKYRATEFKNVPLVADPDARMLDNYKRNWSIALASLGDKAPRNLREVFARMKKLPAVPGCRQKLTELLKPVILPLAKEILNIQGIDKQQAIYCAEIILGIDTRITFDSKMENDKPDPLNYDVRVEIAEPFWGRSIGLRDEPLTESKKAIIPFSASVTLQSDDVKFSELLPIEFDESKTNQSNVYEKTLENVSTDKAVTGPIKLKADIKYKIGDMELSYTRPITANAEEAGSGEKGRKLVNDRRLPISGYLMRDHGNWGMSFLLPNGNYISATAQGSEVTVRQGDKTWISPRVRSLTANSACEFYCTTGWDGLEARVGELKLIKEGSPDAKIKQITANGKSLSKEALQDCNLETSEELSTSGKGKIEIMVTPDTKSQIRGIDMRVKDGPDFKVTIEADNRGKWIPVYWGTLGQGAPQLFNFQPLSTAKLKITLEKQGDHKMNLAEFHLYEVDKKSEAATPSEEKEPEPAPAAPKQ